MDQGLTHSQLVSFRDGNQWAGGRFGSIGSSDAATILGCGYAGRSRYSLWAEKCHGIRQEFAEEMLKRFAKGNAAEPYIAKLCEIDHGWDVQFDPPYSFRRSIEWEYLTSSLDAWMIQDGQHVALEFKNLSSWEAKRGWDLKTGKAPLKYTVQLQHQMLVTGWSVGYLVGLNGYDIMPVRVERHEGIIEAMLAEYAEFWRCVEQRIEPEIDHSQPTEWAVQRVHQPVQGGVRHLDDEESAMLDGIGELEHTLKRDAERLAKLKNELVAVADDAEYLVTTDGQWWSFKLERGKRKLKPHKGKVRL